MNLENVEKISFITGHGLYCYKVMLFGLGITYQRLVNQMFKEQIGQNMDVYVWHLAGKKKMRHLTKLKEAFAILRKYAMKLNSAKCAFAIDSNV